MRLKTFQAASMSEIMRQIKKDLGDDAVIISSRTQDDGSLRVTAAIEENGVSESIVEINDLDVDGIEDTSALFGGIQDYGALPEAGHTGMDAHLDMISKTMTRHNVPGFLHEKIMVHAEQISAKTPALILAGVFDHLFSFDVLPDEKYERPMMLVGQPGAGKTTTIAKLAARAVLNGLKPVVITADTVRAGGVEQLAAFLRVLNLNLIKVNNPEQLKKAIGDNKNADQILIDCPGLNAFDAEAMKELHTYIRVVPMDLIVTLPGGMDMEEATEIARAFAVLGAKWLVPTRIDMTRRLGAILAAADAANLAFAGMGHKPDIADGFVALDAATLAKLFLPQIVAKGAEKK
jgi:flagellar biosynthesis protein FlhF